MAARGDQSELLRAAYPHTTRYNLVRSHAERDLGFAVAFTEEQVLC